MRQIRIFDESRVMGVMEGGVCMWREIAVLRFWYFVSFSGFSCKSAGWNRPH